jgi:hypothetical protein
VSIVVLILVYLQVVLRLFPWTRGLATNVFDLVVDPLATLGLALVGQIPNLIFLFVLAVLVRLLLRVLRVFFSAVAEGAITLSAFDAEWAWPTYKNRSVRDHRARGRRGLPVRARLSDGGLQGHLAVHRPRLLPGLVVRHRQHDRGLRDDVPPRLQGGLGDLVGDVVEIRPQVTHLRTLKNEEVTVPNSSILNAQVTNYSSLAATQGLVLQTNLGIGYEPPWRQVVALLLASAERTAGVARDRQPFVLRKALGDFAIDYELNIYCRDACLMMPPYTALHRNILDVFNGHGVQIMTPAYEADPPQPKLVPKDQWYAPPAQPHGDGASPVAAP